MHGQAYVSGSQVTPDLMVTPVICLDLLIPLLASTLTFWSFLYAAQTCGCFDSWLPSLLSLFSLIFSSSFILTYIPQNTPALHPVFSVAGTTDTWVSMACGLYSSCWHLDHSCSPESPVACAADALGLNAHKVVCSPRKTEKEFHKDWLQWSEAGHGWIGILQPVNIWSAPFIPVFTLLCLFFSRLSWLIPFPTFGFSSKLLIIDLVQSQDGLPLHPIMNPIHL